MKEIIKIRYDCGGPWYSRPDKILRILTNQYTPEMFVIYSDPDKGNCFCLLTDLCGEKVIIGRKITFIPDPNEDFSRYSHNYYLYALNRLRYSSY